KIKSSKELVEELITKLNEELHFDSNNKYAMLVNGMGATPLMEQYVFTNDVLNKLDSFNITPVFMKIGNYMTSIDMAGISLTLFEIKDDKWLEYLNYPVQTIAW
ncbi:MAG: dihydroxyacetone kinase subunit DhaK, partial [Lactobacillus iners]|nr:dihydroxyacetone kinase subunit DhaK [Lactobacillus iners]